MRYFYVIMIALFLALNTHAATTDSTTVKVGKLVKNNKYSEAFALLKDALVKTSNLNGKKKDFTNIANEMDAFLDRISIVPKSKAVKHNEVLAFMCRYDQTPINVPVYVNDTLVATADDGTIYLEDYNAESICISLISNHIGINKKNKYAVEVINDLVRKHTNKYIAKDLFKRSVLFYVTSENLYYAAIQSKEIPNFDIVSDNNTINLATCIKTILKASDVDAKYEEIIHDYMHTSMDAEFSPFKTYNDSISNRKVVMSRLSLNKEVAQTIVDRLCCNRFLIAIDKKGQSSLLTAIALDEDKNPVHVRLRTPNIGKEEQRSQVSWNDFCQNQLILFDLNVFK